MPETDDEDGRRYGYLYDRVTDIISEHGIQEAEDHIYAQLIRWGDIDKNSDEEHDEENAAMVLSLLRVSLWRFMEQYVIIGQTVSASSCIINFSTEASRIEFSNSLHTHLHYMRNKEK